MKTWAELGESHQQVYGYIWTELKAGRQPGSQRVIGIKTGWSQVEVQNVIKDLKAWRWLTQGPPPKKWESGRMSLTEASLQVPGDVVWKEAVLPAMPEQPLTGGECAGDVREQLGAMVLEGGWSLEEMRENVFLLWDPGEKLSKRSLVRALKGLTGEARGAMLEQWNAEDFAEYLTGHPPTMERFLKEFGGMAKVQVA